ncbi:hypothetical protein PR048_014675 [Dryococelus australis]|uniref:Uncharacterized protein n=1 Tax=Dryococelus australis TaxID=614101 RepID=A0ABQ9HFB4_9NEOP|nr:hypothetical protein PR048_014675 [Dryococelus australis]
MRIWCIRSVRTEQTRQIIDDQAVCLCKIVSIDKLTYGGRKYRHQMWPTWRYTLGGRRRCYPGEVQSLAAVQCRQVFAAKADAQRRSVSPLHKGLCGERTPGLNARHKTGACSVPGETFTDTPGQPMLQALCSFLKCSLYREQPLPACDNNVKTFNNLGVTFFLDVPHTPGNSLSAQETVVVKSLEHQHLSMRFGFESRRGHIRIFANSKCGGRCSLPAGLLEVPQFPQLLQSPLHSKVPFHISPQGRQPVICVLLTRYYCHLINSLKQKCSNVYKSLQKEEENCISQCTCHECSSGRSGVVVRLLASHLGEPGSILGRFPNVGNVLDDAACQAGFLGGLPFPPPLHSGVDPHSTHFTRISSQGLDMHYVFIIFQHNIMYFPGGVTVAERLARSPPTKANRAQSPAGSPDFRKWESCRTMPLVGGSSRGSLCFPRPFIPVPLHIHFNHPLKALFHNICDERYELQCFRTETAISKKRKISQCNSERTDSLVFVSISVLIRLGAASVKPRAGPNEKRTTVPPAGDDTLERWRNAARRRRSSVGQVVPQVGALLVLELLAFPPPRLPQAHFLRLEHEALGLHDVEEEFADQVGYPRVAHLQARPEAAGRNTHLRDRHSPNSLTKQPRHLRKFLIGQSGARSLRQNRRPDSPTKPVGTSSSWRCKSSITQLVPYNERICLLQNKDYEKQDAHYPRNQPCQYNKSCSYLWAVDTAYLRCVGTQSIDQHTSRAAGMTSARQVCGARGAAAGEASLAVSPPPPPALSTPRDRYTHCSTDHRAPRPSRFTHAAVKGAMATAVAVSSRVQFVDLVALSTPVIVSLGHARVKRNQYGAAPECEGGGNGRPRRKPADQMYRPARFPLAKISKMTPPGIEPGSPRVSWNYAFKVKKRGGNTDDTNTDAYCHIAATRNACSASVMSLYCAIQICNNAVLLHAMKAHRLNYGIHPPPPKVDMEGVEMGASALHLRIQCRRYGRHAGSYVKHAARRRCACTREYARRLQIPWHSSHLIAGAGTGVSCPDAAEISSRTDKHDLPRDYSHTTLHKLLHRTGKFPHVWPATVQGDVRNARGLKFADKCRRQRGSVSAGWRSADGHPRENPPTNVIVRHYSRMRKSGVTRPGIEHGLPWRSAVHPRCTQQEPVTTVQLRETESIPTTHKRAARDLLQGTCIICVSGIRLNFTVLYILEPTLFLHWLLHSCEVTLFLTGRHVIGAHNCEVLTYWRRITQGVSDKVWSNDKRIAKQGARAGCSQCRCRVGRGGAAPGGSISAEVGEEAAATRRTSLGKAICILRDELTAAVMDLRPAAIRFAPNQAGFAPRGLRRRQTTAAIQSSLYSPFTVTSNFSKALLKFYFQDIPPPRANKAEPNLENFTKGTAHCIIEHSSVISSSCIRTTSY